MNLPVLLISVTMIFRMSDGALSLTSSTCMSSIVFPVLRSGPDESPATIVTCILKVHNVQSNMTKVRIFVKKFEYFQQGLT